MFADNYHAGRNPKSGRSVGHYHRRNTQPGEWDRWYRQHRTILSGFAHGNQNIFGHLTRSGQQPDLFVDRHGLNHFFPKEPYPVGVTHPPKSKREENKKIEKYSIFIIAQDLKTVQNSVFRSDLQRFRY